MDFNGFLIFSTPVRRVGVPAGAFFSEKMTSLDFFDMFLVIFDINSQYLVRFSRYLAKNGAPHMPITPAVSFLRHFKAL